jgi:putative endonuclease
MPFIYILKCSDNTFYTGYAKDLEKRFLMHKNGKGAKYTRGRLPVELVYSEKIKTTGDALRREREVKRMSRKQKEKLCGF